MIELIITIIIIAILSTLAVPASHKLMHNQVHKSTLQQIKSAIDYARNSAINYNSKVVACPINQKNPNKCGTNWQAGIIIQSAKLALLHAANELEDYCRQHHSYKGATLANCGIQPYTNYGHYQIIIILEDNQSYLPTAKPIKLQKKDKCGSLSINQLGIKSSDANDCW